MKSLTKYESHYIINCELIIILKCLYSPFLDQAAAKAMLSDSKFYMVIISHLQAIARMFFFGANYLTPVSRNKEWALLHLTFNTFLLLSLGLFALGWLPWSSVLWICIAPSMNFYLPSATFTILTSHLDRLDIHVSKQVIIIFFSFLGMCMSWRQPSLRLSTLLRKHTTRKPS